MKAFKSALKSTPFNRMFGSKSESLEDTRQGVLQHSGGVNSVAWSPDGKTLASGSDDSTVRLWDVLSGEEKGILKGHSIMVSSVAWNEDGTLLASGGWDRTVKIWDMSWSPAEKCSLTGHSGFVRSVAWSPDGKTLASGSDDRTVRLWDVESGEEKGTLTGHSKLVNSVAFSPDGKFVASGSGDQTVKIWDMSGGSPAEKCTLRGHTKDNPACTCTHEGYALDAVRVEANPECPVKGHSDQVMSVAWNEDGTLLASGGWDQTVKIWDMSSGSPVEKCTMRGHTKDNPVCTCTFGEYNGLLTVANPECPVKGHSSMVTSLAWSPDGKTLASGSKDLCEKRPPKSGLDYTVRLWDVLSGEEKCSLKGHSEDNPECTCNHQAGGYRDEYEANPECPVKGHSAAVNSVAWSPDGKTLASGSSDETARLWDT